MVHKNKSKSLNMHGIRSFHGALEKSETIFHLTYGIKKP